MDVHVQVPLHVQPGQSFDIQVTGQHYSIVCPEHASPGSFITVKLPAFSDSAIKANPVATRVDNGLQLNTTPYPVYQAEGNPPFLSPTSSQPARASNASYGLKVSAHYQADADPYRFASMHTDAALTQIGKQLLHTGLDDERTNYAAVHLTKEVTIPGLRGLALPQPPHNLNDWTRTANVHVGEDYYLSGDVKSIKFGLGWDAGCDVDGSVALFDNTYKCVDLVSYGQLKSKFHKAVEHSGDDRSGIGTGDDEVIKMRLRHFPDNIFYALCIVCVYTPNKSFRDVRRLTVRLYHGSEKKTKKNKLLCYYDISRSNLQGRSMLVACAVRKGPWWTVRALGQSFGNYSTASSLVRENDMVLQSILSQSPGFRCQRYRINVKVLEGNELIARDITGKSDPFCRLKFRKDQDESDTVRDTLNPKWRRPAHLLLKGIDAAEMKKVKITIFDWDRFTNPDFMGRIKIPAAALYNLGLGTHQIWLPLGPDPKRFDGHVVAGEVFLEIQVSNT